MLTLTIVHGAELNEGGTAEMRVPPGLARFTIGRDPANHWALADRTLAVSARHCELVCTAAAVLLRDTSTNGTFVNGAATRMAGDHALRNGDRIEIGPYTVLAQGVPSVVAVPAGAGPSPAAAPMPAALPPAPARRGGDPAAMLSAGGPEPVRLTEMLRAVAPPEDVAVEMTKIRAVPTVRAAPDTRAAPVPGSAGPRPPPAQAPPAADPVLAAMAQGLGLPVQALQELKVTDMAEVAGLVAAIAHAATAALRQVLLQQAGTQRHIGSRGAVMLSVRDVHPLSLAATPESALQALLAAGANGPALLHTAAQAAASHERRLLEAFQDAASRLGTQISPAALQQARGSGAAPDPTSTWQRYEQVWQALGLAPARPWPDNFVEALKQHLAAAYDDAAASPPRDPPR